MFIAGMYEFIALNHIKLGHMLSRETFLANAIPIQTTPEGVAELAMGPHPTQFIAIPVRRPELQPESGKLIMASR